jgi:hypothetical protein
MTIFAPTIPSYAALCVKIVSVEVVKGTDVTAGMERAQKADVSEKMKALLGGTRIGKKKLLDKGRKDSNYGVCARAHVCVRADQCREMHN